MNRRRHGAAGGEQVVEDDDPLTRGDGVRLDLEDVAAVLERILVGYRRPRQLAALAHHDEAETELEGQGRGDEEAARFDAGEEVGLMAADRLGQPAHGDRPGIGVGEEGGYVVEQDPRLGKIGDAADMVLDVHGVRLGGWDRALVAAG